MDARVAFDGASRGNPGPAAVGYRVELDDETREGSATIGEATNNEAEYEALRRALESARNAGADGVAVRGDSQLIVRQINGEYAVNAENLQPLYDDVVDLLAEFDDWEISHVDRSNNAVADDLANRAFDRE